MTSPSGEGRSVRRGEVYIADLLHLGGRLWKHRPVVVVQNDVGNRVGSETIVLAIRSSTERKYPIHVDVGRGAGGLDHDSRVDAGQVLTLLKDQLGRRIGMIPPDIMKAVDEALRVSLGLG